MNKPGIIMVALTLYASCGASESGSTNEGGEGVLETPELTIPIPSGYRALSKSEVDERAKRKPASEAVVAMLERAGHSVIGVARLAPRSSETDIPDAPTSEECGRFATKFAAKGNHPVVTGATLVSHPPEGLGTACQFTIGFSANHLTQISTSEWSLSCVHSPGEGAACQQVAAGFRRIKR